MDNAIDSPSGLARTRQPAWRAHRRAFLRSVGTAAGVGLLGPLAHAAPAAAQEEPRPLWRRAASKGLVFGSSARLEDLEADVAYGGAIARDAVMLTVNAYTFSSIRPTLTTWRFQEPNQLQAFAEARRMVVSGAPLLWDRGISDQMLAEIRNQQRGNPRRTLEILETTIGTCAARAPGLTHSWNVVNEPIATQQGRPDGLRTQSVWFEGIGPEYIELALRAARRATREAGGNALLFFNEFGMETGPVDDSGSFTAQEKRAAVLGLIARLKDAGAPLDALGIQGHLESTALRERFDEDGYRAFLADVASLGVKILVTELDVRDNGEPSDIEQRDAAVAAVYRNYLSVTLDEPAVIAVTSFGLADEYSWLQVDEPTGNREPRADGLPVRPLPLGPHLGRKAAWYAIANTIDAAPARGAVTSPVGLPR